MRLFSLLPFVFTLNAAHAQTMICQANGEFFAVNKTKALLTNSGAIQMNNSTLQPLKKAVEMDTCQNGEQFFFYNRTIKSISVYTCEAGVVNRNFLQLSCED